MSNLRIVDEVPGTRIEPSRVDLAGLSDAERQSIMAWLNGAGASIVSSSDKYVAYYL